MPGYSTSKVWSTSKRWNSKARKLRALGLEHLKGMTRLSSLALDGTPITEAGLEYLKCLPQSMC